MEQIVSIIILVVLLIIFLFFMLWPISIPFLIIYIIRKSKVQSAFKSKIVKYNGEEYNDISPSKLKGFDISDLNKLKVYLSDIFLKFEDAYTKLDYNTMYNLSTKDLYELYQTNINVNLKFEEKRIIDNVNIKNVTIYNAYHTTGKQYIYTMMEIDYINYVIKTDGKIVSGSPTKKIKEKFLISFIKENDKDDQKCPNCGANSTGTVCEYCKTKLHDADFKIKDIRKVEGM